MADAVSTAPAADATAAAATPEAPTQPAGFNRQSDLSEDDRIIAELRDEWTKKQLAPDEPSKEEDKPKASDKDNPKETTKVGGSSGVEAPKYESVDAALAAIVKVLESGDPEAIAKAVGKPKGFMDVSEQKWAAFREQKSAVREREKQVTTREHTLNQKFAEAKKEVGPALLAAKAYNDGKYGEFVTLINEIIKDSGDTYDEAQRKVIKGHLAADPATKRMQDELKQLREELKAEKAKEAEDAQKVTKEQQYARAVEAVRTQLAAHAVSKVKGFERTVLDLVRDSWDGETYTMSFEEAGDKIVEERAAEAEALGFSRKAAEPAKKEEPAPKVPPRSRATDAREPDGEEWMKRDMTDEEIIDSIKRDVKAGRIKVT